MKQSLITRLTPVAMCVFLGLATGCQSLSSQATVSREQAQATALAKAPGGTVKEAELEKEHGRLIWSFDIAIPGSRDITEVQVDARTGEVVSVEKETPADQAREKKQDSK